MINKKLQEIKARICEKFQPDKTMKPYENLFPINEVINRTQSLPSGIRSTAIAMYVAIQSHANKNHQVFASQNTLASKIGITREWANYIIGQLCSIGLLTKHRRGLNQTNIYTLVVRQNLAETLIELVNLRIEQNKAKSQSNKKYVEKKDSFNNYEQRTYDFNKLEDALLYGTEFYEEEKLNE